MLSTAPLLLGLAAAPLPQDLDGVVPPTDQAFEAWQEAFGPEWRMRKDRSTGFAEMVYGWHATSPFGPVDATDWFDLTQLWAAESAALLGIQPFELVPDRELLLPLGLHGGTDKMSVQLRQELGGVPVEGAFVNALYTPAGSCSPWRTRPSRGSRRPPRRPASRPAQLAPGPAASSSPSRAWSPPS